MMQLHDVHSNLIIQIKTVQIPLITVNVYQEL